MNPSFKVDVAYWRVVHLVGQAGIFFPFIEKFYTPACSIVLASFQALGHSPAQGRVFPLSKIVRFA